MRLVSPNSSSETFDVAQIVFDQTISLFKLPKSCKNYPKTYRMCFTVSISMIPFAKSSFRAKDFVNRFSFSPRVRVQTTSLLFRVKSVVLNRRRAISRRAITILPASTRTSLFGASLSSRNKRSDLCRGRRDHARVSPARSSHRRRFLRGTINSLLPSSRVVN